MIFIDDPLEILKENGIGILWGKEIKINNLMVFFLLPGCGEDFAPRGALAEYEIRSDISLSSSAVGCRALDCAGICAGLRHV